MDLKPRKENKLLEEDHPVFTIGIAAEIIGVSVHTLRLYENNGLILTQRTRTKHRLYSVNDIKRLTHIRFLIEKQGLNIAGIKALLALIPCWNIRGCNSGGNAQCSAVTSITGPCWLAADSLSKSSCRECEVYRNLEPYRNLKRYLRYTTGTDTS